jgi:hypothetical protein
MYEFTVSFEGTAPLLMHNSRLANPLDPASKALKKVTGKRNKTDEDHAEMARLEFLGGLYIDPDIGPYIPGENIWRCLWDAAKKYKMGVKVKEGVFITTDVNPLGYTGPRDAVKLWADENFRHMASVKVGTSRTMRCRPTFTEWRVSADGILDPALLEPSDLESIAETAGSLIGLGDWRPRFGRFVAEVKPR